MEKYFSSTICRRGFCSAYNTIYKNDHSSEVFILSDGDDTERAEFFTRLLKNFKGYALTAFNPFYDETIDGIFIKNLNTYILAGGNFNRVSPLLPGEWEKCISIADTKKYPSEIKREIIILKKKEAELYKKACKSLYGAGNAREKSYELISESLDDEKLINFLKRFCARTFRGSEQKGCGTVRLLSTPTPLGIHTHWNTVFDKYETVINISDGEGFVSSVILGIIKDFCITERLPFIMSPSYSAGEIPQFLLFPEMSIAIVAEDASHTLPFDASHTISAQRFLKCDMSEDIKSNAFLEIESRLVDTAVMHLFEGRDARFKYNDLIKDYSDTKTAVSSADKLTEMLMN